MPTKPKVPTASKQKTMDNLRSHLIGYHDVPFSATRYKSLADLQKLHDSVKEVRWCGISRTTQTSGRSSLT